MGKIAMKIIQLAKAEYSEFTAFYAIYRENIRFRRDWAVPLYSIPDPDTCYWLLHNGRRIGGAMLAANQLGPIFSIPPHSIADEMLDDLLTYVKSISGVDPAIEAMGVPASQIDLFERKGFVPVQTRRCMMSPTFPAEASFSEDWLAERPHPEHQNELVAVLHTSFVQGTGDSIQDSEEELHAYLADYFHELDEDPALRSASTVLIDKSTNAIAGACLIGRTERWPFIAYIAVLPDYRGRGLASAMILHALASLHPQEPMLQLFVTVGNKAEQVYENLGFWSAPTVTKMRYENK